MDALYFALSEILQPFTLLVLLVVLALVWYWRKRQSRRRLILLTVPVVLLVLLCTPALAHVALGSLEWQYRPLAQPPADADAMVVLAGAVRPPSSLRPRAELSHDTYYRCLHAVELYRARPCPIVVSGGKVDASEPGPACAEVMRDFLREMGVKEQDVLVENESRTTYENAVFSRRVLEPRQARRVVLVTDAVSMFRAVRCFEKQGLAVTPAPCDYRTGDFRWELTAFLPNPFAAKHAGEVGHEWVGCLWYWLRGRM
jgi:uncharacterized SAM-binding protein YcdF (DUF218 family)